MQDDLISRSWLVSQHCAVNCGCTRSECGFTQEEDGTDCCSYVKEIESAPSVEAEPKWISVKERLPEAEGNYLVCSEFADIRSLKIMTFALNLESVDEYCFAGEKRPGWWDFDGETGNYEWSHVTHWMPLPELPEMDGGAEDG